MKMLLKSAEHTASIVASVKFHRNYAIGELNRINSLSDITDKDKQLLTHWAKQSIDECNNVLDAMNVAD